MELLHDPLINPVAIGHPAGDRGGHIGSQMAEGTDQQGGAGHAVRVVVAANPEPIAPFDRLRQQIQRRGQVGKLRDRAGQCL